MRKFISTQETFLTTENKDSSELTMEQKLFFLKNTIISVNDFIETTNTNKLKVIYENKPYYFFGSHWQELYNLKYRVYNLPNTQSGNIERIKKECEHYGLIPSQVAYVLATTQHESRYMPINEYSSGQQYEGRTDLGNTQKGDGVRFKGRGFVQITGRTNYKKYSEILGIDLIKKPNSVLNPDIACFILVHGMVNGVFTGKKLSTYINSNKTDFINARRIINGTDRSGLIAGYAQTHLSRLT